MKNFQMTFQRYELKYLLDSGQYEQLCRKTKDRLLVDTYGKTTICNIYFDTPDRFLIRKSLEKPVYKEKLRLRSYGVPGNDSTVFLELKKKYRGVVYKRREDMVLSEAEAYLYRHEEPGFSSQVLEEINWTLQRYDKMQPSMHISYERVALYDIRDPQFRVTLDNNILWRNQTLNLKKGAWGNAILLPGQYLMEVKIEGAMPLWFAGLLDELQIYPVSFSKYGRAYQNLLQAEQKGGVICA